MELLPAAARLVDALKGSPALAVFALTLGAYMAWSLSTSLVTGAVLAALASAGYLALTNRAQLEGAWAAVRDTVVGGGPEDTLASKAVAAVAQLKALL